MSNNSSSMNDPRDVDGPLYFAYIALISDVLALICNTAVIIAVLLTKRLQTTTNGLVLNMTFCNIVFCVFILPTIMNESLYVKGKNTVQICKIFAIIGVLIPTVILYTLMCIAIVRYIAIVHPSKYYLMKTKLCLTIQIFICWFVSSCNILPYYLNPEIVKVRLFKTSHRCLIYHTAPVYISWITWGVGFTIPSIIVIFCYIAIFLMARSSRKMFKTWSIRSRKSSTTSNQSPENIHGQHSSRSADLQMKRRETKLATTTAVLFVVFLLSFVPSVLYRIFSDFVKSPYHYIYYTFMFYWFGLFINPLIYGIINKEFRKAYKLIFNKLLKRHYSLAHPAISRKISGSLSGRKASFSS